MLTSISTHHWTSLAESEAIRTIMDLSMLYESSFKHSRFKKFIETGDGYTPGFAIVLHDCDGNRIGLALAHIVKDCRIPGGLRKRTRSYGYAGDIETPMDHNFRPLAEIGLYVKPDFRGFGLARVLLTELEKHLLKDYSKIRNYGEQDIPIFQLHEPAFEIAVKHLEYSRPVRHFSDNFGRRNDLHEWSNAERPINKYDEYARIKSIKPLRGLIDSEFQTTDLNFR